MKRTPVYLETSKRRTFVCALDWPGWCRAGKDEALALEAFAAAKPRYRHVAKVAGVAFDATADPEVVERHEGGAGTAFGVPSAIAAADHRPVDAKEARRLAALVEASWTVFDATAAGAPLELRKGPRGGGRDRDRIVGHVVEADGAYAREMGLKLPAPATGDRAAVSVMRARMLDVLRAPSDGAPLAGRRWTHAYAARRIAWHALDHAWEIEDRTEPSG
jgi:hypothetical protein